jgi:hypothetical protein
MRRMQGRPCHSKLMMARTGLGIDVERSTPISPTKPEAGPGHAGWSPRSSGIPANSFRASASSSPTCRARPSRLSPSKISAAHVSSGSKRVRERSNGRGCHSGHSRPTPSGFSFMRSPTISAISCARCDSGANQTVVAEQPEGEADQDRCQARQPRLLCRHLDGRGRHLTPDVRRDPAADRRTPATA